MSLQHSYTPDGQPFRDLNHNGVMEPFEDSRLSAEERADDLMERLSIEEKIGLLFQTVMPSNDPGDHDTPGPFGPHTQRDHVLGRFINHYNVMALPDARTTVRWYNALQVLAEQAPHGIPITMASDPRHGFTENVGMALSAGFLSQWPELLGLAAIGDESLVRTFADVARREYRALGIRSAIHPQIDLSTEPRWARQMQTFGQSAEVTSRLASAYLAGLQGDTVTQDSVATCAKHFPGGGPQKDGEDPHFPYGREQVYPGGCFDYHLEPFRAVIAGGVSAMMPYYGMPVGLVRGDETIDEVGFGFNEQIVTGLLRNELGFDGVVVSDWGIITDITVGDKPFPAKAWGLEDRTPLDRLAAAIAAGVDQLGGEACTELLSELVRTGVVTTDRVDESARRVLLVKFRLGLFDDPYVDEETAATTVGRADFRAAGHRAQAEAITVLTNDGALPLRDDVAVFVEGMDADSAARYGRVVSDPAEADVALVRLAAPFEPRDTYFLENVTHQGSLDFPDEVIARITELASKVPVIVDVYLDRPAILAPITAVAAAVVADFGASDTALLDALSARIHPRGRLPIEIPRSMDAVRNSRPDVPSDTADPLFAFGFGLDLPRREAGL